MLPICLILNCYQEHLCVWITVRKGTAALNAEFLTLLRSHPDYTRELETKLREAGILGLTEVCVLLLSLELNEQIEISLSEAEVRLLIDCVKSYKYSIESTLLKDLFLSGEMSQVEYEAELKELSLWLLTNEL